MLGKLKIILLMNLGVFLLGCSKSVEEDLPKKPIEETSIEVGNPPTVQLISGGQAIARTVDKYCWEQKRKTCALDSYLKLIYPMNFSNSSVGTWILWYSNKK